MLFYFLIKNIVDFSLLTISVTGLVIIHLWLKQQQKERYTFITHITGIFLWFCIISLIYCFISAFVSHLHLQFLTPSILRFIAISIALVIGIHKLYCIIDLFEQQLIQKGRDITDSRVISKTLKIITFIIILLIYGEHFGMNFSGLLAFGGIGGLAVGMASKDILSNFFSGVMLYFDRPFSIGDWIRSPDREIEGTVAEIGWRMTKIITFDHRPFYIPNSLFSSISVENPGRMTNRRIKTTVGLRYDDAGKLSTVVEKIRNMLLEHPDIDQSQTLLVYFTEFADSSLNILVYCFTKTTDWQNWLAIQQEIYLNIIHIVKENGADFAFPSHSIYLS